MAPRAGEQPGPFSRSGIELLQLWLRRPAATTLARTSCLTPSLRIKRTRRFMFSTWRTPTRRAGYRRR